MPKKKRSQKAPPRKPTKKVNKAPWLTIAIILILIGSFSLAKQQTIAPTKNMMRRSSMHNQKEPFDFEDKTITLDNQQLPFVNGLFSDPSTQHTASVINKSVSATGTRAAAIVVDTPAGSGTFYYLIGAMQKNNQEIYSTPILIGDRIKIQSVTIDDPQIHDNGNITIQYFDRPSEAPMATQPTIMVVKKYAFEENGNLLEILH